MANSERRVGSTQQEGLNVAFLKDSIVAQGSLQGCVEPGCVMYYIAPSNARMTHNDLELRSDPRRAYAKDVSFPLTTAVLE